MLSLRWGIALLLPFVALAGVAQTVVEPQATAKVELFSPQGEMREVRQVTARFSVPMVALGDPRLPDPFDVNCPASGNGRWVDVRNWAYDFDADLPAGLRCTFQLRKDLKSASGVALSGKRQFSFTTGGPSIVAS